MFVYALCVLASLASLGVSVKPVPVGYRTLRKEVIDDPTTITGKVPEWLSGETLWRHHMYSAVLLRHRILIKGYLYHVLKLGFRTSYIPIIRYYYQLILGHCIRQQCGSLGNLETMAPGTYIDSFFDCIPAISQFKIYGKENKVTFDNR